MTEYHKLTGVLRLDGVAQKLHDAIQLIDPLETIGSEKMGQSGASAIAALARALVGVEKEIRESNKASAKPEDINQGFKIVQMAPVIPSNRPQDLLA